MEKTFGPIKKQYLSPLKEWRNSQTDVLRQNKRLTDSDQEKWFLKIRKDKTQKLFSILDGKKFIGYCGLTYIDHFNRRAEISFLVDPERAKDAAVYKEDFLSALKWLSNYGFNRLKLHKIFVETFEFRKSHLKILEEFGFKREAVLRGHYYKKGKFYNSLIHSIYGIKK